jgi:hypothetical protein
VEVWQRRDLAADSGRLASAVPVRSRLGSLRLTVHARGYQKPLISAQITGFHER